MTPKSGQTVVDLAVKVGAFAKLDGDAQILRAGKEIVTPRLGSDLLSTDDVVIVKGTATIQLTDGAELTLATAAQVKVTEKMVQADAAGSKPYRKRIIAISTGKVSWRIPPAKATPTDFEFGDRFLTVRVEGTEGDFDVAKRMKKIDVVTTIIQGEARLIIQSRAGVIGEARLAAGQKAEVVREGSRALVICPEGSMAPLVIRLANGVIVKVDPNEAVALSMDDEGIRVQVVRGIVEVLQPGERPLLLGAGEEIMTAPPTGGAAAGAEPDQPTESPTWSPERRRVVSPEK
jgi:ferric-dicitrate binding protein FerR (iron transport regulator)